MIQTSDRNEPKSYRRKQSVHAKQSDTNKHFKLTEASTATKAKHSDGSKHSSGITPDESKHWKPTREIYKIYKKYKIGTMEIIQNIR